MVPAPLAPTPSSAGATAAAMGLPTTSSSSSTDLTANPPLMAHYEKLRKELRELIARKKAVDKNLESIEEYIFKFETTYLEDTQNGNIVRGFDNYIKGTVARRRAAIGDADRVFSMSSYSYMKAKEERASAPSSAGGLDSANTSATNTPSTMKAPLSTSSLLKKTATGLKRKKKSMINIGDDDSESHSEVDTPIKKVRISFSGQNMEK